MPQTRLCLSNQHCCRSETPKFSDLFTLILVRFRSTKILTFFTFSKSAVQMSQTWHWTPNRHTCASETPDTCNLSRVNFVSFYRGQISRNWNSRIQDFRHSARVVGEDIIRSSHHPSSRMSWDLFWNSENLYVQAEHMTKFKLSNQQLGSHRRSIVAHIISFSSLRLAGSHGWTISKIWWPQRAWKRGWGKTWMQWRCIDQIDSTCFKKDVARPSEDETAWMRTITWWISFEQCCRRHLVKTMPQLGQYNDFSMSNCI